MGTNNRILAICILFVLIGSACNLFSNVPTTVASDPQTEIAQTVAAAELTAVAEATTPPPSDTPTSTPTQQPPTDSIPCDKALFVSETIPDNTAFAANAPFTKTWRMRNVGSCTWTTSYALVFDHGSQMGGAASISLTGSVAPGQEVDLTVSLQAPSTAGSYTGNWRLRNASGVLFYTTSSDTFTVKIVVNPPTPTPTMGGGLFIDPGIILFLLPRVESHYQQVNLSANSTGSATVACPDGSIVVGGGFAGSSQNMVIYTSAQQGNGWQVYAKNYAGGSQLLNAYAVCLFNSGGTVSQVLAQVTISAGGVGNVLASCPAGSVVTGGGFASDPDKLWVYNISQDGNNWHVYARNLTASNQILNSYAICLSGTSGVTSQAGTNLTVAAGGSDGKAIACPSGSFPTGGGYALSDNLVMYSSSMTSAGSGWEAYSHNVGGSGALMNVYVTCLSFP